MERESPHESEISVHRLIEILDELDTTYKDEIPTEMIDGDSEDRRWKVTKNWWLATINALELAKSYLNQQDHLTLMTEIDDFNQTFLDNEFKDRLTTETDIATANNVIRKVINALTGLKKMRDATFTIPLFTKYI